MGSKNHRVAIIGAGPGGLTAGMILARRGFEVTIYEKQPKIGGRNAELAFDGYSFDTGPTFLHQKFTLDEAFLDAGRKAEDYLDFRLLDPMTRLSWGEVSLDTTSDPERMAMNIGKAFPGDADGYLRFMEDHEKKLRVIYPCLQRSYHNLGAYMSSTLMKALPYVATRDSVVDVLDRYFKDDRLKLAFTFQAKYLGMSPWKCPGLFSILSYIEYKYGIHHVQGGLCRISDAMAQVIKEHGGAIRLGSAVKEMKFNGTRVTGLLLEDGEFVECDEVVLNADYAHAVTTLMGERSKRPAQLERKKYSCSTFMLYLGVDRIYREQPHHHVIFSNDYLKNVQEIQGEREISRDMSIYVRNSSITDPTVAPDGCSGIYVLVPTINMRHGTQWSDLSAEYRDRILEQVEKQTALKGLRNHIVAERVITPADWRDKMDVFMGATFNLAHTLDQMLYLRPHNRMQGYENLYLVGGGTHPGSGLPTIYESGRISSNLICDKVRVGYESSDLASALL